MNTLYIIVVYILSRPEICKGVGYVMCGYVYMNLLWELRSLNEWERKSLVLNPKDKFNSDLKNISKFLNLEVKIESTFNDHDKRLNFHVMYRFLAKIKNYIYHINFGSFTGLNSSIIVQDFNYSKSFNW